MKKMNKLLFFFGVLFVFTVGIFILPQNASADKDQGTGGKYYCILCEHRDTNDPLYEKEQQFYRKVSLIKQEYGDSIDEIVLASSVLHRYGRTDAYNALYTKDFNEAEYSKNVGLIKKAFANINLSSDEVALVQANERYDLLTLAAIVMNDSSKGGQYSDACFKEGLAGNKLVSNDSNGFFANIFNAVVCAETKLKGSDAAVGDSSNVQSISEKVRISNINKVCENGYVGGLYDGIKDLKNEDEKQAMKEHYAQQIIDFANFYKDLYSYPDENSCTYNGGSVGSGEMTNWRQCDSKWGGKIFPGGSSVCSVGCLATSMTYLIAKSGTQITVPTLDPGVFVDNTSYLGNLLIWDFSKLAPNFVRVDGDIPVNVSNAAKVLGDALNTPCGNNNQPFIVLFLDQGHWVALDHVEGSKVYVMDPSYDGDGLALIEDAWKGYSLHDYSVFCPSDISFGTTGSSSTSSSNKCEDSGGSLESLVTTLGRLEGMLGETCTVRGVPGYVARVIEADQHYVGTSTAYGITQMYGVDMANSVGYSNFDADMSSGCAEQSYINQMAQSYMQEKRNTVREYYEEVSGGKKLEQYQYDALALIHHHWPAGCLELIEELAKLNDVKSYEAYKLFLEYNGLGGMYGGIVRREVEFHLFYNGNYDADRDFSADSDYMWTRDYYNERIKVYNSEEVQGYSDTVSEKPTKCVNGKAVSKSGAGSGLGEAVVKLALEQLPEGGSKFWDYVFGGGFYNGDSTPWCACFVTWVLDHAFYNGTNTKDIIDVRSAGYSGAGAGGYLQYAAEHGMLKYNDSCSMYTGRNGSGTYTPKAGDLIIFSWNSDWGGDPYEEAGHDHIGIVQRTENGVIYTIEGNSGNAVREKNYSVDNCQVSAFIAWE